MDSASPLARRQIPGLAAMRNQTNTRFFIPHRQVSGCALEKHGIPQVNEKCDNKYATVIHAAA